MKKDICIIPYIFPTNYQATTYPEMIGYDPYISYIGVMRDTIEKSNVKEEYWN